jgi:hypothetical protein
MKSHPLALSSLLRLSTAASAEDSVRWENAVAGRDAYREALDRTRKAYGGAYKLPAVDYFLFGMGPRDKFVYIGGKLNSATSGKIVREWAVEEEVISPAEYTVGIKTKGGKFMFVTEDEEAVWVEADGEKKALSKGPVTLPDFNGRKHRLVLRVLHQELLVNVLDGKPLPSLFVYDKPSYRDGAMMAMAFEKTNSLPVVKEWMLGLREPFDRNNKGGVGSGQPGAGAVPGVARVGQAAPADAVEVPERATPAVADGWLERTATR